MRINPNEKFKFNNITDRYAFEDDIEHYSQFIGQTLIATGRIREMEVQDDNYVDVHPDEVRRERAYEFTYTNMDDETDRIWLFPWNVIPMFPKKAIKSEADWLDRIQQNFKE